ncbi:hypothetical protein CIRG_05361 [Coccidioides immitis RMSCC 2394]|uniref:Uncharacterized protein n=1 Tax=Coccidioides immitis RMSCC 2394 TaxID=404692 RepID=A0A0J6YDA6_COCIT|nr:hypothetical protein CIRG_05361 [Coccidioides immitis RMSCC 2394]
MQRLDVALQFLPSRFELAFSDETAVFLTSSLIMVSPSRSLGRQSNLETSLKPQRPALHVTFVGATIPAMGRTLGTQRIWDPSASHFVAPASLSNVLLRDPSVGCAPDRIQTPDMRANLKLGYRYYDLLAKFDPHSQYL